MTDLTFKGGYGEHGRSCFLIAVKDYYIILDCGIMDTDPNPYPDINREILEKVKYMFVSHHHEDHIGAFEHFVDNGFCGKLVISQVAYILADINYNNTIFLDTNSTNLNLCEDIEVQYGRSGHCVGSLWFNIKLENKSYFYSGDFQAYTHAYICDVPENVVANVAIIDAAHKDLDVAENRSKQFIDTVQMHLDNEEKVVLPVQPYGRGIEILLDILKNLSSYKIAVDKRFLKAILKNLEYQQYFKQDSYRIVEKFLDTNPLYDDNTFDILLIGDSHLVKQSTQTILENVKDKFIVVATGKVAKNEMIDKLKKKDCLVKCSYTHHQSFKDIENWVNNNEFGIIVPFHNDLKQLIV
ncbi:MAG: hypothetical protein ATN35_04875 [Epulopiscium sp. Nele67-Bin004]|nr:MAG: hypothetical protein ATN35_04875 [Epulopiscium sp. Nele67-Bin004]